MKNILNKSESIFKFFWDFGKGIVEEKIGYMSKFERVGNRKGAVVR